MFARRQTAPVPMPIRRHPRGDFRCHGAMTMASVCGAALLLAACGGSSHVTPVTTATVQAVATQVAPTVAAVGSAIQGTATQIAPTVAAAQTQVAPTTAAAQTQSVSTVQAAATQIAPTVAAVGSAVQGTATQVAPTVGAAQTQTTGTVQAAATSISPTIAAQQTAIAPTVAAAATQAAPTRQALATAAVGTFGPAIATSTAASPVQITAAAATQGDATVSVRNSGTAGVNISDWMLLSGNTAVVLPVDRGLLIGPNTTLTLHFASGTNSATDFYLGQPSSVITSSVRAGDRVALVNLVGQVASVYQLS